MKKNFYISLSALLVSGFIIKILGLLNRILIIRFIGTQGITIYTLITPTITLYLALSQFGFPLAISAIISRKNRSYSNREIIFKGLAISFLLSFVLITSLLFIIKPLANLLNNQDIIIPLLWVIPLIPLVSFTGILKGYFNGIGMYAFYSFSTLLEQCIRVLFSILVLYYFQGSDFIFLVSSVVISLTIGELASVLFLLTKVNSYKLMPLKKMIKPNHISKEILSICIPTTSSRLIGNITYFFEPILYTITLVALGYNQEFINEKYTAVSGYAIPLLTIASFFSLSICTILVPEINKEYEKKNFINIHNLFNKSLLICYVISLFSTLMFFFYPKELMLLLFKSTIGSEYVRFMAIPLLLLYYQPIFTAILQTLGKAKETFFDSLVGSVLKIGTLVGLAYVGNISYNSLVYSIIVGVIFLTSRHLISVLDIIKYHIDIRKIAIYLSYMALCFFVLNALDLDFLYGFIVCGLISIIPLIKIFYFKKTPIIKQR